MRRRSRSLHGRMKDDVSMPILYNTVVCIQPSIMASQTLCIHRQLVVTKQLFTMQLPNRSYIVSVSRGAATFAIVVMSTSRGESPTGRSFVTRGTFPVSSLGM